MDVILHPALLTTVYVFGPWIDFHPLPPAIIILIIIILAVVVVVVEIPWN